jgi:hypothetical protein
MNEGKMNECLPMQVLMERIKQAKKLIVEILEDMIA